MSEPELPLLDLFMHLREAEMPLGIDDYRNLLRVLQLGFGTHNAEQLRRVCSVLWVKSSEDKALFDYHFDQLVKEWAALRASISTPTTDQLPNTSTTGPQIPPTHDTPPTTRLTPPTSPPTPTEKQAPGAATTPTTPMGPAGALQPLDVQATRALQAALLKRELPLKRFVLSGEYHPVTRREMKQHWRYLRRMVREGPAVELDVEKTVKKIGREGVLLEPVLIPHRINHTELLMLVDQGGSMVPFHALSRQLVDTALRGGRLGHAGVYYFHDVPRQHLYLAPALLDARPLNDVLAGLHRERTVVLIFSDAGAARGNFDPQRIEQTQKFLDQLKGFVRRMVWLNPMPRERWEATSAASIADILPMFALDRRGLGNAIDVLRGRYSALVAV